jgi:hypothetical protein
VAIFAAKHGIDLQSLSAAECRCYRRRIASSDFQFANLSSHVENARSK